MQRTISQKAQQLLSKDALKSKTNFELVWECQRFDKWTDEGKEFSEFQNFQLALLCPLIISTLIISTFPMISTLLL